MYQSLVGLKLRTFHFFPHTLQPYTFIKLIKHVYLLRFGYCVLNVLPFDSRRHCFVIKSALYTVQHHPTMICVLYIL